MLVLRTSRREETFKIGQLIGAALNPGDIVCLHGDLGAGKTVLTQGIGRGMGINQLINSPTFTLVNEYIGRIPLYHLDLYRLADPAQLEQIGWEEYVFGPGAAVIEWPEVLIPLLPADYLKITLEKNLSAGEDCRLLTLEGLGPMGHRLSERLRPALSAFWESESPAGLQPAEPSSTEKG